MTGCACGRLVGGMAGFWTRTRTVSVGSRESSYPCVDILPSEIGSLSFFVKFVKDTDIGVRTSILM